MDSEGLSSIFDNLLCNPLRLVPIGEVIDKNGRAGLRETVRNGFSNSRAGPRDNGPLILQTFVRHFMHLLARPITGHLRNYVPIPASRLGGRRALLRVAAS